MLLQTIGDNLGSYIRYKQECATRYSILSFRVSANRVGKAPQEILLRRSKIRILEVESLDTVRFCKDIYDAV